MQGVVFAQDAALADRFFNEAPLQWEAYRKRIEQFHGTVINKMSVGDRLVNHMRFEYRSNASCRLSVEQSLLESDPVGTVSGYNRIYSFSLLRKSENRPWVVTNYTPRTQEETSSEVRETNFRFTPLRRLIRAYSVELSELIRKPTFRLLRVAAIEHEGDACMRIEFDNWHELESNAKDFDPVQSGVLLLDPHRYWCLRGCELRTRHSDAVALIKEEVQLRDPSEKVPVPKRIISVNDQKRSTGERLQVETVMEFDLFEPSRLPRDKEFSLSAFGLPEPLGVSWSRTPWYLWVGLAGILFLLVGAGFYWLKRRREAAGS